MRTTGVGAATAAAVVLALQAAGPVYAGPAAGRPPAHDHPAPTPQDPHAGHTGGHEQMSDDAAGRASGPTDAKLVVLGGFGAVNAAAIGTAYVLRRRDGRHERRDLLRNGAPATAHPASGPR